MIEQQSREGNAERRKPLLWATEKKLAEEVARPIIFYAPTGACWQPYVKGLTLMRHSRSLSCCDRSSLGTLTNFLCSNLKRSLSATQHCELSEAIVILPRSPSVFHPSRAIDLYPSGGRKRRRVRDLADRAS
jgi:hypothetical protein